MQYERKIQHPVQCPSKYRFVFTVHKYGCQMR